VSALRVAGIRFYPRELRDLAVAWVALGLAFSVFFLRYIGVAVFPDIGEALTSPLFARLMAVSLTTVGVGFLLHELAHKVVAVRFGQVAAFRADYGMLALAVGAAFAGFIFAAPGAVHHRGRITPRENGMIAVAGPLMNVALVAAFLPLAFLDGFLGQAGQLGVIVNAFLAAFNMIPFGPLDGRKVVAWSKVVFIGVFLGTLLLAVAAVSYVGLPSTF
jgi:Zn-dependent protease